MAVADQHKQNVGQIITLTHIAWYVMKQHIFKVHCPIADSRQGRRQVRSKGVLLHRMDMARHCE